MVATIILQRVYTNAPLFTTGARAFKAIIGKQQHGPTGRVELAFEAEMTRCPNLAREESLPEHF